jgi:hypothetical protein
MGELLDGAKALANRFDKMSKTKQILYAFPALLVGFLLFAKALDPNGAGKARSDAREARHAMYVAKCKPLWDKYSKTQENFGLNATKREQDNAYIDFKTCEAGERVDAIVAGEINIPGR